MTDYQNRDVIMRSARISADDSSTASSMHESVMRSIHENESVNQMRLQQFMGMRRSRGHVSEQRSRTNGASCASLPLSTITTKPHLSKEESREEMLASARQVSLIKDEGTKRCALTKFSSSFACVSCVAGIPKEISQDMSDLSDPIKTEGSKSKRVAFLSDLVDGSDKMDGSLLKENEAKEIVEKIENHIKKKEGMKWVSNERIQESVSKIREKIYQYRPDLDEYSQHSALTFKDSGMSRAKLLACLGFDSLFIEDDSWSCDSSTNVPMGLGTSFTYEDDFEL